jgi:hypothetical protein
MVSVIVKDPQIIGLFKVGHDKIVVLPDMLMRKRPPIKI